MVVDLHAHYPMHLIAPSSTSLLRLLGSRRERRRWRDRMRGLLTEVGSRLWNYPRPDRGPAVTVPLMRAGGVGAALSVLYVPLDEMDLGKGYGALPDPDYFPRLVRQLELVEDHLAAGHDGVAAVARNGEELEAALKSGRLALVHSVEGGFHLGATPGEVESATWRSWRGAEWPTSASPTSSGGGSPPTWPPSPSSPTACTTGCSPSPPGA